MTCIRAVKRLTCTFSTPSMRATLFSTLDAHAAQLIPTTRKSCLSPSIFISLKKLLQFFYFHFCAFVIAHGLCHAMLQVLLQDGGFHLPYCCSYGTQLHQNIGAISPRFYHTLHPLQLPAHPVQSRQFSAMARMFIHVMNIYPQGVYVKAFFSLLRRIMSLKG